jgi:hypothetical protein
MKKNIYNQLCNSEYSISSKALQTILKEKITNEDIIKIFSSNNYLIIADFLEEFDKYDENTLKYIENYIINHLDDKDRLFVSDLIEFATEWGLSIPYEKCIGFVKVCGKDDDYVGIASIDYIYTNFKLNYFDDIYKVLNIVINNTEYNQSAQLRAAMTLFRYTHNKKYYLILKSLVEKGDENNRVLLKNKLNYFYNSDDLFIPYEEMKNWLNT